MHEIFESEAISVLFDLNFAAGAGFPAKQHKQQVSMIGKRLWRIMHTHAHTVLSGSSLLGVYLGEGHAGLVAKDKIFRDLAG